MALQGILDTLQRLGQGRTTLFVAHRLSTAARCDQVEYPHIQLPVRGEGSTVLSTANLCWRVLQKYPLQSRHPCISEDLCNSSRLMEDWRAAKCGLLTQARAATASCCCDDASHI